jgi:hypothetical protein
MGLLKEPRTLHKAQELLHDYRCCLPAERDQLSNLLWAPFSQPGVYLGCLKAHWAETRAARDPFEPRSYSAVEYKIENLPELFALPELHLARWTQNLATGEIPPPHPTVPKSIRSTGAASVTCRDARGRHSPHLKSPALSRPKRPSELDIMFADIMDQCVECVRKDRRS